MPGRSIRDEMQQPAQPRAFGAPLGPAAHVGGVQRNVAGPAAPDAQRKAIAAHEAQAAQEAKARLYQKPVGAQAQPAAPKPAASATGPGVSVFQAAHDIQSRPAAIDQAVTDAGG